MDVSQSLDHQILLGYQSTFTEEELDQWVQKIDYLYTNIQTQLAALPDTSSLAEATTATTNNMNMKKTTTLDQLHVRNTENENDDIQPRNTSISDDKVDKEIPSEDAGDLTTITKEIVIEKTVKAFKPSQKEKHINNKITKTSIVGSSTSDSNATRNTSPAGSFSNTTYTTSKSTLDSTTILADSYISTFEKSNYTITTSPIIATNITNNNNLSTVVSSNHEVMMANEKGDGEGADVV
ncbi:MAG: hypothetical protein ACI8RD_008036 [Bacillariaceae sp.]|jgi:hypothetical protein